jgi:two-component system, chemotaxis family, sensor kinase CheA
VYADHGRSVAIVVEEILDIVDGEAAVQSDIDDLGLLGSAVIGDRVTELLDVRAAILAADPAFYSTPAAALAHPTDAWSPAGLDVFDSGTFDPAGLPTTPLQEV